MNKEIMLSIQPKHLVNILNGNKTLELRKSVPKDFKGWVNLYVTNPKKKPFLNCWYGNCYLVNDYTYEELINDNSIPLNGKVVARFWFDEYEKYENTDLYSYSYRHRIDKLVNQACITEDELYKYIKKVKPEEETTYRKYYPFYAWHIKQLEIFDEPLELSDFIVGLNYLGDIIPPTYKKLKKAPQSYQFVYRKDE